MRKEVTWVAAGLALAGIAAFVYDQWFRQAPQPQPQPPVPAVIKPVPETKAEPKIQYPVEEPSREKPLPALGESDAAMKEALEGLFGQKALAQYFYLDDIIRRIVATVDNLPRGKVSQRLMPVKPAAGKFLVSGKEDDFVINPANSSRYAPYVRLAQAVNVKKLVALYVYFYSLFHQAY